MHDMSEIAALLHIHKEASAHGGALDHIANQAMAKLKQINAEANPKKDEPPAAPAEPEGPKERPVPVSHEQAREHGTQLPEPVPEPEGEPGEEEEGEETDE